MIYKDKSELIRAFVSKKDIVLDVGFWGQGIQKNNHNWPHEILKQNARTVYGVDTHIDSALVSDPHYLQGSAESFDFSVKFDVIFAGDIIEHLSNSGLFLKSCRRNLAANGRLIITTPNAFNLFNIAEKISKREPTVNKDHVCYYNDKTLSTLLNKNGFTDNEYGYLYTLNIVYAESYKKRILNVIYFILSKITSKYIETLVVITK